MPKSQTTVSLLLPFLLFILACNKPGGNDSRLAGPYLGQTLPGDSAVMFAHEHISAGRSEGTGVFSPDGTEFIFSTSTPAGLLLVEPKGVFGKTYTMWSRMENGYWTEPIEFLHDSGHRIGYRSYSPDGTRIFFGSPGSVADTTYRSRLGIWYVERQNDGWSEPREVDPGEEYQGGLAVYPSVASSGNVYFALFPDGMNGALYVSRYEEGRYMLPERLSETVNSLGCNHPYVAPDESYILFDSDERNVPPDSDRYDDLYGAPNDIFISFRDTDGSWMPPMALGAGVNSPYDERRPFVTGDGEYLFFASDRIDPTLPDRPLAMSDLQRLAGAPADGFQHLYWVSTREIWEQAPPHFER